MNSLHIGNSGNKFNLVPDKLVQNNRFGKINQNFLKDIQRMQVRNKGNFAQKNFNINMKKQVDTQNKFREDVLKIKQNNTNNQEIESTGINTYSGLNQTNQDVHQTNSHVRQTNTNVNQTNAYINQTNTLVNQQRNQNINQENQSNQVSAFNRLESDMQNNIQNNSSLNVNWTDIFLTVCKKRLFNYFRELKMILNRDPYFNQKLICYIDEKCAKYLVDNTKNDKVMTLRMILNGMINQQIKGASNMDISHSLNLNKALDLVKNLELMGPSNNLLIALSQDKIEILQVNYLNKRRLYWPNGNEGITWLTSFD